MLFKVKLSCIKSHALFKEHIQKKSLKVTRTYTAYTIKHHSFTHTHTHPHQKSHSGVINFQIQISDSKNIKEHILVHGYINK